MAMFCRESRSSSAFQRVGGEFGISIASVDQHASRTVKEIMACCRTYYPDELSGRELSIAISKLDSKTMKNLIGYLLKTENLVLSPQKVRDYFNDFLRGALTSVQTESTSE